MATATKKKTQYPKVYDLVTKKPVARFYYQGSHTHPVRRTVLMIEDKGDMIIGYELREGSTVRSMKEAMKVVKSYRKDRIPKWGDYSRLRMTSKTILKNPEETTLERFPIVSVFRDGI